MRDETKNVSSLPVGESLLGRVLNEAGEPIDGKGSLGPVQQRPLYQPRQRQPRTPQVLQTGIKVVDLFAPLVRGGLNGVFAGPGVGRVVVLNELIHNQATRGKSYSVLVGLEEKTHAVNDLLDLLREQGVAGYATIVFGRRGTPESRYHQVALASLTLADYFREQGQDVLLFIDQELTRHLRLDNLRDQSDEHGSITTIIFGDGEGLASTDLAAFDTQLAFNRDLGRQSIWPAVDPLRSRSLLLEHQLISAKHQQVAAEARALLRRLDQVQDEQGQPLTDDERRVMARARLVRRFQSQPFFVAEPYTARPGEYVQLEETIDSFRRILDGACDKLPEEALSFVGTIQQARAKAS